MAQPMTLDEAIEKIYRRLCEECTRKKDAEAKLECRPLETELNIPHSLFNLAIESLTSFTVGVGGVRVGIVDAYYIELGPRGRADCGFSAKPPHKS